MDDEEFFYLYWCSAITLGSVGIGGFSSSGDGSAPVIPEGP
jgi:hypothetical protein